MTRNFDKLHAEGLAILKRHPRIGLTYDEVNKLVDGINPNRSGKLDLLCLGIDIGCALGYRAAQLEAKEMEKKS